MFEGFNPNKAERDAIERGLAVIYHHARSEYEVGQHIKAEHRGYGNANDRVPLIAAKGMVCRWFIQGISNADALLRNTYNMRPAAIFMQGLGAQRHADGKLTHQERRALAEASEAYDRAFERMQKKANA